MMTSNGTAVEPVVLYNKGIYLLMDTITPESCKDAIEFVLKQNAEKKKQKRLQFMICSPGGDVPSCFALIDVMKGSRIPIHTVGLGVIASCGLLLFITGEKGKRTLTPNTSILSHQYSWGSYGKEHELFAQVKEFEFFTIRTPTVLVR
jgi:ATP-dependent Clp protease protease subunit